MYKPGQHIIVKINCILTEARIRAISCEATTAVVARAVFPRALFGSHAVDDFRSLPWKLGVIRSNKVRLLRVKRLHYLA
jgi:hypothetical protein